MPLWRFIRGHKIAHLQLQLIYQSQHLKITRKKLVNFTIREMSIRIWINTPTTTYPPPPSILLVSGVVAMPGSPGSPMRGEKRINTAEVHVRAMSMNYRPSKQIDALASQTRDLQLRWLEQSESSALLEDATCSPPPSLP